MRFIPEDELPPEVIALRKDMDKKEKALNVVQSKSSDYILKKAAEAREEAWKLFGEEITEAMTELSAARAKHDAAFNELRTKRTLASLGFPEGTIFRQQVMQGYRRVPGKVLGRLEVFRTGDPFQKGLVWRKPCPGDAIIRELRKDGSPSKKIHHWEEPCGNGLSFENWKLEPTRP